MSNNRFNDVWRVLLVYVLVLAFAVAVVIRIVFLQVSEREELMAKSREMDIKAKPVNPVRGSIYSKNGTLMAASIPVFDVFYDYKTVKEDTLNKYIGPLSDSLAKMFKGRPKQEFMRLLRKGYKTHKVVYLAKGLRLDEYNRVKSFPLFNGPMFKNGLGADVRMEREFPYGELAARTVGYVREIDGVLRYIGLEGWYDSILMGKPGFQVNRRLNNGRYIPVESPLNVDPINGCDIYTSIDIALQDVAEEALRKCLEECHAAEGCVVMMDVQSGMVEVMANLCYSPITKDYRETNNFAIGGKINPGSTFKAITMTALLENNPNMSVKRVLNLGTTKQMSFGGKVMTDSHLVKGGKPTIEEAFWESSNIAFAMLTEEAFGNNPQRFIDLIYKTRINEPLHLDLKGPEINPLIKSVGKLGWSKTTLSRMSIGYEVDLAPITMLTYYNAIANNGRMVKPQFVRQIRRGNEVVMQYDTVVICEHIASDRTIKILQDLLRGVVENGTAATAFKKCALPVAGKTGTSQYYDSHAKGFDVNRHLASFVGYFPVENPKYTCIVVVSQPKGANYYGAGISAPVFKDIVDKVYATSLGIKDETVVYKGNCDKYMKASMAYYTDVAEYCDMAGIRMVDSDLGTEWVTVSTSANGGVSFKNVTLKSDEVPDLKGMNVMDAVYLIESMGWKVEFNGSGIVDSQSVKAGTKLEKGKTISLKLK